MQQQQKGHRYRIASVHTHTQFSPTGASDLEFDHRLNICFRFRMSHGELLDSFLCGAFIC